METFRHNVWYGKCPAQWYGNIPAQCLIWKISGTSDMENFRHNVWYGKIPAVYDIEKFWHNVWYGKFRNNVWYGKIPAVYDMENFRHVWYGKFPEQCLIRKNSGSVWYGKIPAQCVITKDTHFCQQRTAKLVRDRQMFRSRRGLCEKVVQLNVKIKNPKRAQCELAALPTPSHNAVGDVTVDYSTTIKKCTDMNREAG